MKMFGVRTVDGQMKCLMNIEWQLLNKTSKLHDLSK